MAWSQQTTADIVGTVTDVPGAVLPEVKIIVHNLDTAADFTATSDTTGNYIFTLLPVGRYSMKATASGCKTWTVTQVTLAIGDRLRQDIRLEVGGLEQSIEVTGSSPLCRPTALPLGISSTQLLCRTSHSTAATSSSSPN
jgi:hypothetical protein